MRGDIMSLFEELDSVKEEQTVIEKYLQGILSEEYKLFFASIKSSRDGCISMSLPGCLTDCKYPYVKSYKECKKIETKYLTFLQDLQKSAEESESGRVSDQVMAKGAFLFTSISIK